MLGLSAAAIATPSEPAVKLSRSGICHDSASPSYAATKNFEPFNSIKECLTAGGQLPKNRRHVISKDTVADSPASQKNDVPMDRESDPNAADAYTPPRIPMIGLLGAGAGIAGIAGWWFWRRKPRQLVLRDVLEPRQSEEVRSVEPGPKHPTFRQYAQRNQRGTNSAGDLERQRSEGQKLESKDAKDIKRTPLHRQDPWLRRIGYFKNNKK
jgi:hypothetical protein